MKKLPLHIKILIGLALGLLFGLATTWLGIPKSFTIDFIKPFGTIFVNALKMIAVPLVFASLIVGVANLGDISKLSRMGGKTIGIYLITTIIATSLGLLAVNIIQPGKALPEETREKLMTQYTSDAESRGMQALELKERSPLQPLVDMVPPNVVEAAGSNSKMLQVVFFAIIIGVALLKIPKEKGSPVIRFFDGLNEVIIKIVDFVMMIAPVGIFALIATLIVELGGDDPSSALDLLMALGWYALTVLAGLVIMAFVIYPSLFKLFAKNLKYKTFFKGIRPAQLLAFSTSSSSATLPLTMERCEKHIGISEEVSSFVLPVGATINMDGTSLYQAVAAVFIAQALGMDLSIAQQLMIVMTATLASIGSAGVPGAGMVMLVVVLEAIGIPAAGIALIMAPDRILDMCRTVVNVTGDASVATIVASTEGELQEGIKENEQLVS